MSRISALAGFMFTALLIAAPVAHADELYYAALDLAIENSNADGAKELKAWGPEHTVMYQALQAIAKNNPDLAGATKASAYGAEKRYSGLTTSVDLTAKAQEAKVLMTKAEALVSGCGFQRQTKIDESDLGFTAASRSQSVTTTYRLDSNGKKKCDSSFAKTLSAAGLNQLVIEEVNGRRSDTLTVTVGASGTMAQDMRFVKSQLLKAADIDRDFLAALNTRPADAMIGGSSDITLVGSNGHAAPTDSFQLKYYIGSGDCPAGCINRRYVLVDVTPIVKSGSTGVDFKLNVTPIKE